MTNDVAAVPAAGKEWDLFEVDTGLEVLHGSLRAIADLIDQRRDDAHEVERSDMRRLMELLADRTFAVQREVKGMMKGEPQA